MADLLTPALLPTTSWLRLPAHHAWLGAEGLELLNFSKNSKMPAGFGALDLEGNLPNDAEPDGILTARMTHAYALAALQGIPGTEPMVEHGVRALLGPLRDHEHDGWLESPSAPHGRKQAYYHAFVALAGSSAVRLGVEGGRELLEGSTTILERRFWSEDEGVMRESFAFDWSDEEDYRGANSNMHSTESCLALSDVTGDRKWLNRAQRIVTRFVHEIAARHGHTMPEHFDRQWHLLRDYNIDRPTDELRPFGMTPGHFMEWSHLTLKLEAALLRADGIAPDWMLRDAHGLFESGLKYGWAADGQPGILYTIDWDRRPKVPARAHWVQAEAITAAVNLLKRTGHRGYEKWYRTIWDYVDNVLIDRKKGSWFNEVGPNGTPTETVYPGKGDLYHAYQSTIAPLLPLAPSLASAILSSDAL
ncbi:AGE family epimerase/isomerase [Kozakia baliensis]|uniref:D-mannose isomerase n=1 Tax=Kozakia baliensis TaxID=153496 RepID=UPI00345BDB97